MGVNVLLVENNGGTTRRVLGEAGLSVTEVHTTEEMERELMTGDHRMVVITLGVAREVELEAYRQAKKHTPALPVIAVSEILDESDIPDEVTSVIHKSNLNRGSLENQLERHVRKTLQLAIEETEDFFSTFKQVGG